MGLRVMLMRAQTATRKGLGSFVWFFMMLPLSISVSPEPAQVNNTTGVRISP